MSVVLARNDRNTPTCVGKTSILDLFVDIFKKHPHVRGEDEAIAVGVGGIEETPPRAWGRLDTPRFFQFVSGNTPTCVGKTKRASKKRPFLKKHPHVRGEDRATG